jgi:hypothetical protein
MILREPISSIRRPAKDKSRELQARPTKGGSFHWYRQGLRTEISAPSKVAYLIIRLARAVVHRDLV